MARSRPLENVLPLRMRVRRAVGAPVLLPGQGGVVKPVSRRLYLGACGYRCAQHRGRAERGHPRMRTRLVLTALAVSAVAAASALAASASGAGTALPTLTIALNGTKGITVSGSMVSGAVSVVSTFTGKAPSGPNANSPEFGLVRLNPGANIQ